MKSYLSPHAKGLLDDIIDAIADAQSITDALRWNDDIQRAILTLEDHPLSGDGIPLECFDTIPPLVNRLRQLIVKPYRIVYEPVDDQIRVLAILHSHQLITEPDTLWDK